jgi:prepilin-type N-terminal cleavage/methylation domain-containing protein
LGLQPGTEPTVRRAESGFSLIEVLVAAAVSVVLAYVLVFCLRSVLQWNALLSERQSDESTVSAILDRWQAEANSAWAAFTPPLDLLGQNNTDGHELDFFTRDGKNRPAFWAYRYDGTTQTLQRYVYASPGDAPAADGPPLSGVVQFSAHTYPVTALQDTSSPIYSPLYAGAALQPSSVGFGYANAPWVAGGNAITDVRVGTASVARHVQLVTQTAPSGFIVELDYTPAPSPSASPSVTAWPAAVRYAEAGTQIAAGTGSCTAVAYADSAFTQQLPPGTADPWGAGASVDGSGCYNGGQVVVHEANYTGTFADGSTSCSSAMTAGGWSPSNKGPTASQFFSAGSATTTGCTAPFIDANGRSAQVSVQVIAPCWEIGGTCTYSVTWPNDTPYCYAATLQLQSGYDGTGTISLSPSGVGTLNVTATPGGDSFTFTRSASGTATIVEAAKYDSWSFITGIRGTTCHLSSSYYTYLRFDISSV